MSGTASNAAPVTATRTAASHSADSIPITAAIGPQIAKPIGWKANEPNQS
jgi:hypothetical protein